MLLSEEDFPPSNPKAGQTGVHFYSFSPPNPTDLSEFSPAFVSQEIKRQKESA